MRTAIGTAYLAFSVAMKTASIILFDRYDDTREARTIRKSNHSCEMLVNITQPLHCTSDHALDIEMMVMMVVLWQGRFFVYFVMFPRVHILPRSTCSHRSVAE